MPIDERRLRYFLAIVDEGGVTAPAVALHVAQPSLSQALRSLERELGAELFVRVGRGLALTSAGRALIGPARQVLLTIEAARAAVGEISELVGGSWRSPRSRYLRQTRSQRCSAASIAPGPA